MDVATDTCILINLAVVGRLDLLKAIPPYLFHAATEVLGEIQDLDQRAAVHQAIADGHLNEIKLDQPGELSLFVNFNVKLNENLLWPESQNKGVADHRVELPRVRKS